MINKTIKGDLLTLFENFEFDVIIHGCNCFNTMGAGIARSIKQKYPLAYEADCKTVRGDHKKLGTFTDCQIQSVFKEHKETQFIVNAYTQFEYGGNHPLCYPAVESVFRKLNCIYTGLDIGIPKIGAGLAGGDWEHIQNIINSVTPDLHITLVELF